MNQLVALVGVGLFTTLVAAAPAHAEQKPYSLADLKALVSQKSFQEAVAHLGDVAPTERKDEWKTVATTAAIGYLESMHSDDLVARVYAIESLDTSFPVLLESKPYVKSRAKLGLTAYEACFANTYSLEACFEHANKFVDADATNAELTLAMAKLMRRSAFAYASTHMFKKALTAAGKGSAAVCKDDDLETSVVAALGLPADHKQAAHGRDLATSCYDALKKPLLKEFAAEGTTSYFRENTCKLLMGKKALDAEQAKKCD
jgi:hypothetical protein